jgi:alpha-D-xyloside xylohydrolase
MKFTDGHWLMRPGVQAFYPVQVYDVEIARDSFTVYAPTRRVLHRGDTHDCPLLTVRFSSPIPNVIRVQMVHHKGTRPRKPEFELQSQADQRTPDRARGKGWLW